MFLYSTLCLVRRWIHAHASVYGIFGRFLWFFYGHLYLAVACSTLSVLEEHSSSIFWEIISRYVVFSGSWFDSGYMFMSFYGGVGLFTEFPRTLRSVRTWHANIISAAPRVWQPLVRCCSGVQNTIFSGRSLPETFAYSALVGSTLDTCLRQFTELLEFLTCRARRRHGQWYVLGGFARHDTPLAVFLSIVSWSVLTRPLLCWWTRKRGKVHNNTQGGSSGFEKSTTIPDHSIQCSATGTIIVYLNAGDGNHKPMKIEQIGIPITTSPKKITSSSNANRTSPLSTLETSTVSMPRRQSME